MKKAPNVAIDSDTHLSSFSGLLLVSLILLTTHQPGWIEGVLDLVEALLTRLVRGMEQVAPGFTV